MSEKNLEKPKGNKTKIILIILCLVMIVGGGAFGTYLFLSKDKQKANAQMPQNQNVNQNINVNMNNNFYRPAVSQYTFELGEFLLNLSDTDARRFLKAKIHLGFNNKKMLKELESKKPVILDSINSVLRAKKHDEFSPKGTENIKMEILNKINPMFQEGLCDNVYFTEILVQ